MNQYPQVRVSEPCKHKGLSALLHRFLETNADFSTFGAQHLNVIGLTVASTIFLPWWATRSLQPDQRLRLARWMSCFISFTVIVGTIIRIQLGDFDPVYDLPLDLCNLGAVVAPLIVWKPYRRASEVFYYWVMAGTLQAVLTPDLVEGFPNYMFLKFWVAHAGLVVLMVYVAVALGVRPTLRGIWRALLWIQVYLVLIYVVNLPLGSNYFFVIRKPANPSILDYLGPWPWYIVACQAVAVVLFFLAYLPFKLTGKTLGNDASARGGAE